MTERTASFGSHAGVLRELTEPESRSKVRRTSTGSPLPLMHRRAVVAGLLLLIGVLSGGLVDGAQALNASVASGAAQSEDCRVEPRSLEEYAALAAGEAQAVSATPILGTPPPLPVSGTSADPAVITDVSETVAQLVACTNAGDLLRLAALYSDEALARFGGAGGESLEQLTRLATPEPLPAEREAVLESVEDVRVLPDGRVTAVTTVNGRRNLLEFVEEDGRYLVNFSWELPAEGTPSP